MSAHSKFVWSLILTAAINISAPAAAETQSPPAADIRVPAEWEPQEAVWLQWPGRYEKSLEEGFAKMSAVIIQYQKLHVLCASEKIKLEAKKALAELGANPDHSNLIWHIVSNDNAWMRDNGPVYVVSDGEMRIQNWNFNAWGGAFGADVPYADDNDIPQKVGEHLNLPVDDVEIVHERGNLEFNGVDAVISNWSTIGDPNRNPGYTRQQAAADFKRLFGVSKAVLIEGVPKGDLTKGHVDGIARFISADTVVVAQCTEASKCRPGDGEDDEVYEQAAKTIESAGFHVIRDPMEAAVGFGGRTFNTNYLNWLVGNGFVIVVGFGHEKADSAAKDRIQSYFPIAPYTSSKC